MLPYQREKKLDRIDFKYKKDEKYCVTLVVDLFSTMQAFFLIYLLKFIGRPIQVK